MQTAGRSDSRKVAIIASALHKVACLPVWDEQPHKPPFRLFLERVPLPQYMHPDLGKIIVRPWTHWAWCAISTPLHPPPLFFN